MADRWDDEKLFNALREAMSARRAVSTAFVEAAKNSFDPGSHVYLRPSRHRT